MRNAALALLLACSACSVAPQPASLRTVAAFEVPLSGDSDRDRLISLLSEEAKVEGFHVDAYTADELQQLSDGKPMTINATVWRGKNDDEPIANVIDIDRPGLACLTFAKGQEPERAARFRDAVMRRVRLRWPRTRPLPIMPTGAIPLHDDLVLTKDGYRVKRLAASRYELPASSPLIAAG